MQELLTAGLVIVFICFPVVAAIVGFLIWRSMKKNGHGKE